MDQLEQYFIRIGDPSPRSRVHEFVRHFASCVVRVPTVEALNAAVAAIENEERIGAEVGNV
jgi:hypothetical protein